MANLTYLSDMIGPRLTGSAALKKANEWTAGKMRSYGLSNVHLEGWTIPAGWERGPASLRIIEPNIGRSLTVAAMGWTPGTNGKISGEVVVIKARNSQELAKYKGKLKNAVVLRGEPAAIPAVSEFGRGYLDRRRGKMDEKGNRKNDGKADAPPPRPERNFQAMMAFRRELSDFLRKEGAAVLLMDAGKPHGLLTMTGSWRGNDRVNVPGFAVRQDPVEYGFSHHSQSDTLDKAREPDLIQGAQVMAVAAVRVANLPELLPRDKPAADRPRRNGAEKK